ncbi:MAG: SDR family oxidoreductase [bacterium]|nr:SDR family oxidoreductase [bacterium]
MAKTILITGAGSGFGKGVALALAAKGHKVIAGVQIASQKTDLLAAARTSGVELEIPVLDITREEDRETVFARDINVLVNNAGHMETGPAAEIPMAHVRRNYETNVFGTLAMVQGFAPQMVKRGKGKIVTVSSIAGLITIPFGSIYCSTKHALEAMMEGLSIELHGTGVEVCTVNPGVYNTGFNDRGAETMAQWFNPETSLSLPETLAMVDGVLDGQLDPQEQIDDLVRVIEEDNPAFRNLCPKAVEPWIKAAQALGWEARSNQQIWVDPSTA